MNKIILPTTKISQLKFVKMHQLTIKLSQNLNWSFSKKFRQRFKNSKNLYKSNSSRYKEWIQLILLWKILLEITPLIHHKAKIFKKFAFHHWLLSHNNLKWVVENNVLEIVYNFNNLNLNRNTFYCLDNNQKTWILS